MAKLTHCKRGHPRTPDNLTSNGSCKVCMRERTKNNPEKNREKIRKWRERHPEEQRERSREWNRKWAEENPDKARDKNRKARLKKYGLTIADEDRMIAEQSGVCRICKTTGVPGRALGVDHCHATGKNRGLLCTRCNIGVGCFKDAPELLQVAVDYLRETS